MREDITIIGLITLTYEYTFSNSIIMRDEKVIKTIFENDSEKYITVENIMKQPYTNIRINKNIYLENRNE